jgi:hypothetical protein
MKYKISKLQKKDWPPLLSEIPTPPEKLFFAGEVPDYDRKFLCIVGARKYSQYGLDVVNTLVAGLRGLPVTIVSGLALGIDSIAHRAALRNKLPTIAIPGSGLSPFALLGHTYRFEHTTTLDKFIYEAELRTGVGAHYRYAYHLRNCLNMLYKKHPELRGVIFEGSAEPE